MAEPFQEIRTSYKRHEIVCTRDKPGRNWYIVVTAPSGLKCYDGWWQESSEMLPAEAVEEAKRGAMLIRPTPSQEGRSSLSVEGEATPGMVLWEAYNKGGGILFATREEAEGFASSGGASTAMNVTKRLVYSFRKPESKHD